MMSRSRQNYVMQDQVTGRVSMLMHTRLGENIAAQGTLERQVFLFPWVMVGFSCISVATSLSMF